MQEHKDRTTTEPDAQHSAVDPAAASRQLRKILQNVRFQTSPRCYSFLEYVVEQTLAGRAELLKERTLGIEVFHRDLCYSTSADPVVRNAASETRKKLAQYYCENEHRDELRILIPSGTYAAAFELPREHEEPAHAQYDCDKLPLDGTLDSDAECADSAAGRVECHAPGQKFRLRWLMGWRMVALLFLALLLGAVTLFWKHTQSDRALRAFWSPFLNTKSSVLISTVELRASYLYAPSRVLRQPRLEDNNYVDINLHNVPVLPVVDSNTVGELIGYLRFHQQNYFTKTSTETSIQDLQNYPTVVMGGFDNDWTLRLTREMRYFYGHDEDKSEYWIADRKSPATRLGAFSLLQNNLNEVNTDYALIVRLPHSEMGQPILIFGGITPIATGAAMQFLNNERALREFVDHAPPGWQDKNVELLIGTQIVAGKSGPPRLISSYIW